MSPDQGRRGRTKKDGGRQVPGPAAARRLGLIVFGVAFLVLFVVVAIGEGVGHPSVPSGAVALVQSVPSEIGEVTKADFEHTLELVSKQAGEKTVPKPGDAKYEEAKENALNTTFEGIWLQGQAEEWGIEVTDAEIAKELKKVKKESFKSEAEFKAFLKKSGYNSEDVNQRVKLQILSTKLQEELKEKVPQPSHAEVVAYYDAAKSTQFTQKPTREIRMIVNKDRKKAEEAFQALGKDDSAKNWEKVAKKYSEDPAGRENGGLQKGIQEGILEEPLGGAVFATPEGQVEGPLTTPKGYVVFEVENSTPENVQKLETVESQIQSTLAQRAEQEYFTTFVAQFSAKWTQRTFCASGYVTERCANYKYSGHPSTAPEGCFEANPKSTPPEGCPAPVAQVVPALPGTVTPLEPKGKPLAQRPHPAGEEKQEPEAAAGIEGLPEGAAPPAEAPPAEGE